MRLEYTARLTLQEGRRKARAYRGLVELVGATNDDGHAQVDHRNASKSLSEAGDRRERRNFALTSLPKGEAPHAEPWSAQSPRIVVLKTSRNPVPNSSSPRSRLARSSAYNADLKMTRAEAEIARNRRRSELRRPPLTSVRSSRSFTEYRYTAQGARRRISRPKWRRSGALSRRVALA